MSGLTMRRLNVTRLEVLNVDLRSPAACVVVLGAARMLIAVRAVELNRSSVGFIHVEPDCDGSLRIRRALEAPHQFTADAASSMLRGNLDGLNVSKDADALLAPIDNSKA